MNRRLCGCTFIHPRLSVAQGMALARRFGFECVDVGIGGGNAHFDPVAVAERPQQFAQMLRLETQRHELRLNECFLLNFGWPINTPEPRLQRRTRDLFAPMCDFARLAGFESILLIPGPAHRELGRERSRDLSAETLGALLPIAMNAGLRLNVEPDVDSCAAAPTEALDLCRRVPGLSLTLDYSHFVCQGIAPAEADVLHPFVRHVHVRQAAPGKIVAGAGEGTIDFPAIVDRLERAGYAGRYCVEYLSLDDRSQTIQQTERRTAWFVEYFNPLLPEALHA